MKEFLAKAPDKYILDVCCGGRSFWFNDKHPNAIYLDKRSVDFKLDYKRNKQHIVVSPDYVCDFTDIPFASESFKIVVFDPPHGHFNKSSIMYKKYGSLSENWKEDLRKGFSECFRLLEDKGVLIFKWAESYIKIKEVLSLSEYTPLIGHKTTKTTFWFTFVKTR